tara:strand:- start:49 stop:501 length:453 start_codon:yes stop_codon:yes gene_type:complete
MSTKTIKKVYKRLAKQKTDLKTQKVDLSLVDDVENLIQSFELAESDASYLAYDYGDEVIDAYDSFRAQYPLDDFIVNGNVRDLEQYGEELFTALEKLKASADELGVDPNELVGDFDDLYQRASNWESLNNDALDKYREVIQYAGLPDFWR